jgi:hypothetical protein
MGNISRSIHRINHTTKKTITNRFSFTDLALPVWHKHTRGGESKWSIGHFVLIRDKPRLILGAIMTCKIETRVFIIVIKEEIGGGLRMRRAEGFHGGSG